MIRNRGRQEALAIEGVNGETEDIDIVELLLKTLGKGEILPYGIGNIVVIELAKFDVRHPDIGMPLCRMGQRQVSAVILPNIVSGQECGIFGSFIRCEQTWKARSTGFEKNFPDSCNKKVSVRILFQKFPCVDGSGCKHVGAQVYRRFSLLVMELFSDIPAISKGILRVAQNSMAAHSRMNLSFCSRLMIRALR